MREATKHRRLGVLGFVLLTVPIMVVNRHVNEVVQTYRPFPVILVE